MNYKTSINVKRGGPCAHTQHIAKSVIAVFRAPIALKIMLSLHFIGCVADRLSV